MPREELPVIPLRDYVNGVVHENIVGDYKVPENSVNEAVNMNFDTMGAVQVRRGITRLGNQISASTNMLGLHQFLDEGTGTNDQIVTVNGSAAYYLSGSTWTSIRGGLTSGRTARFTNFLDRAFMVNGADATLGWNGDTSSSFDTTNLSGAPISSHIETYRSRLWTVPTSNPSRVEYSSVPSSAGAITWDSTEQFIDVSPGDGEDITGLKRSPRALLIFKPGHSYRILNTNNTDPDPQILVGTYSQESIVETKMGIFFHDWNNSAIHIYAGGRPDEVSRPIKPYLEGVSLANRGIVGGWADTDNVYHAVGDVALNGVTFINLVTRYTVSTQIWALYSYPVFFRHGIWYDDGSTRRPVVADNDGSVHTLNVGNDDNGTPITFSLVTRWYDLDGVRSHYKTINQLGVLSRNAQGVLLEYQTDTWGRESEWRTVREIRKVPADVMDTEISGHRCRFRISGTSVGEPFFYEGIEILRSFSELVVA